MEKGMEKMFTNVSLYSRLSLNRNGKMDMKTIALTAVTSTICLSLGALASAAPLPYTPDADTQLLYHLDETSGTIAADASGNGRDATYRSQVILGQTAQAGFDKAIRPQASLNARTTYTDTGAGTDSFLYADANASFTIDSWVKLDVTGYTGTSTIFTVAPSGSALMDYRLGVIGTDNVANAGALSFSDRGRTNKLFTSGGLDWDVNTWYHVALEVNLDPDTPANSFIRIIRNAADEAPVVLAELTGAAALIANDASIADRNFEIGNQYANNGDNFFPGLVDEVRFTRVIPEPATGALGLLGLSVMMFKNRRSPNN